MTTDVDDMIRYTLDELKEFQAQFNQFFAEFDDQEYERRINVYRSGFSSHLKFPSKLPAITHDLYVVAGVTGPALISQLVDQLIDLMDTP